MGSSPRSTLDRFQRQLLEAFFEREKRFFLTGGAALAGFHLGHRKTRDLDRKLSTLLSRTELRDLVDVRALEQAGYRVEDALEPASRKEGGLTAGQLAWVLSEIEIGEDAEPPGVPAGELREYLDDLVRRLTGLAFPSE